MAAFSHSSYCFFLLAAFMISCTSSAPAPVAEGDVSQSQALDYQADSGSTRCYYNFQHYEEGDRIITNEPCLNCTCHKRMLMCYLRVCPFTKAIGQDCTVEKKPDQCCPVITCPQVPVDILTSSTTEAPSSAVGHLSNYGCTLEDNTFYPDGVQMPSDHKNPCELCYCIRNQTACVRQECTLNVEGCRPVYQEGVCCPTRYDCDTEMAITERPTTGGLLLGTTASPLQCRYGDILYNDGELIESEKPCESCYCMRGDIVCAVRTCGEPLEGSNCEPLPIPEGKCCPTTYKCENGTFPVDELVTKSSISMHPADSQAHEVTDYPKQNQPVLDATDPSVGDSDLEKPVKIEDGVLPSEQPTEEEHENDKNVDQQTDVIEDHVLSDPTEIEEHDELSHAVEADDTVDPDNTHLATDAPLLINEHLTTDKIDAGAVDSPEATIAPGEVSAVDINQSNIPSESDPKPEEENNSQNIEAGSGEEPNTTESGSESHEESDIVSQPQDSIEKGEDEIKDESLTSNPQDNVNNDEVSETTEGHDEQKVPLSSAGDVSVEEEPTKPEDPLSESEIKPDTIDQSTDTSVHEPETESATENDTNLLIHEDSVPSVPSTPEALDQIHESSDPSMNESGVVSGLSDNEDSSAEDPNNEENLIHEESAFNNPNASSTKDEAHESETSSQSGTDTATVSSNNGEEPSNEDKGEAQILEENVSDENVKEANSDQTGSFQKDPIPPRRDDAVPEELDQQLTHPEGSMTKAEDSIPEDQTQATFSESEQPDNIESISHEETDISSSSTKEQNEPNSDDTNTNTENVDPSSENTNEHVESDEHNNSQQDPLEPMTGQNEEEGSGDEQTVSPNTSDVVETDSGSNEKTPEQNVLTDPLAPVVSDENKPNENVLNLDTAEQESVTDTNIKEQEQSEDPIKEISQETSISHDGQEDLSGDINEVVTNNPGDDNLSESTQEPPKEGNVEETNGEPNSQHVAELSDTTPSNSVSNDDSLVSSDDNVESSTKDSNSATEEATNNIQTEADQIDDKKEDELPVPLDEHAETTIQSIDPNQAQETSKPENDGTDPEGTNTEISSSELSTIHESVASEEVHTELPEKEANNESDALSNLGSGAQPDKIENENVDADEPSVQSELAQTNDHISPSDTLHEDTNANESGLQEVPHDPVEYDPHEFDEEEIEGGHVSPSENEIDEDNISGNGGSIKHDTAVPIPGPVGVIPGEGDCLVDGKTYTNNSKIPSKSECHKECTCISSVVHCQGIDCPPPPPEMANCMPVYQPDKEMCCPAYTCVGNTPEGPQSHNQIGGIEEPLEEEHTSPGTDSNSDNTSSNLVDPHSQKKDPSDETSEQTTGAASVAEDSNQVVEAETQSSVAGGSDEPVEGQSDETNNQLNIEGSSDQTENESSVSTDSEITHEEPNSEDSANHIQTTDLTSSDVHNETPTVGITAEDHDSPAGSLEENSNIHPIPDDNIVETTHTPNNDIVEQQSIVAEEHEDHHDAINTPDTTDVSADLPSSPQNSVVTEQSKPVEEDPNQSGTDNDEDPQSPNLDSNTNSEIATEASGENDNTGSAELPTTGDTDGSSSEKPENDGAFPEEISHAVQSEEDSVAGESETIQDTASSVEEDQDTPEQGNEQTTLASEEVNQPTSEEVNLTDKNNGALDDSTVNIGEETSDPSKTDEGNKQNPIANADESSQGVNTSNENVNQESVSDTKDSSEVVPSQNNDGNDDINESTENVATTSPFDDKTISQTHKITDEPSQSSNNDDESSLSENSENTEGPSSSLNQNEGEIVFPDAIENSSSAMPSVEEGEKEESPIVVKETSPVNDNNEGVNEDESIEAPQTPIIEEQGPNVAQTTEDIDSNVLATEANLGEGSDIVKPEITDGGQDETETAVPDRASSDGPSDNSVHDNAEESNVHNEHTTEGYTGPNQSSETERPTAGLENNSITHVDSTKEPDGSFDSTSTPDYNENAQSPESDSLKLGEDSEKEQTISQVQDSTHEVDPSNTISSNTDNVVTHEEGENKPVIESSEIDEHESHPEASQFPSETSGTDETSQSNENDGQVGQQSNTPEESVGSAETTETTNQPTKVDTESDETSQGEVTHIQSENETPVQDPESDSSVVETVPEVEGAQDIASDHKEESTESNNEDTSINELITASPDNEDQKQDDIPEQEVDPAIQDGGSEGSNSVGDAVQEHVETDHESDDHGVEQPPQEAEESAQDVKQPENEVQHPSQEVEQHAQESEQPTQAMVDPTEEVEQSVEENEHPTHSVEDHIHESENPVQAVEDHTPEDEQPTQTVEEHAQENEQPSQAVEDPAQEVDEQSVHESEHPVQAVEDHDQGSETPTQVVKDHAQEDEQPSQAVEDHAQELQPAQENEQPTQAIENHDQEGEIANPTQAVEDPNQFGDDSVQESEKPSQTVKDPVQDVDEQPIQAVEESSQTEEQTDQEVEHTDQEAEHVDKPIQEAEHTDEESDHLEEPTNEETDQTEHHSEQSTHETVEPPSQSQEPSSLPVPSEETHITEDELKPDLSKPDDSEIPAEDQFPSNPDMDYDGTEDGAFGPGTCRYGGKVYVSAQQIPRDDPCDFCFCFRSDIICLQQSCPPPIHRCHQEPIQGYCCPRYQCPVSMATSLNLTTTTTTTTTTLPPHFFPHAYLGAARQAGCLHKGRAFSVGQEITTASGPCLHCICGANGQMRCDPVVCSPEPQLRRMMEAAIRHRRR